MRHSGHRRSRTRRVSRGFTLLEAIVAMTIMALALIPLVTFIAQSADQLHRAGDSNDRSFAMQSALALMDPVNPSVEPAGQLELDRDLRISWRSDIVLPPNEGILVGGGLGGYRLGFYTVHVDIKNHRDELWFSFDMRKTGYNRIQSGAPF